MMAGRRDNAEESIKSGRWESDDLLKVSPEQRMQMRNIPFFVLPPHEYLPRTSHIKAKIDTHNQRYTPAKSPMKPIVFTQKLDYSHVQSRIDIGSPKSSLNSKQYLFSSDGYTRTRSRVTPNHSRSSSASKINPGRSISPSSKPVRLGSSAQYSHIKSRIDCGHPVVSHSESSKSTGSLSSPRSTLSQSSKSDYSHIKSRTDSGRKSAGSMSTKSQRSTSLMSRNKTRVAETTAAKSTRGFRSELQWSRQRQIPLSDPSLPKKAKTLSPSASKYPVTGLNSGSPDNLTHKRAGNRSAFSVVRQLEPDFDDPTSLTRHGDKNHRSQLNYRARVKSKIDCSDPNPAVHNLKHSLNELIIPLGEKVNPRFENVSSNSWSKSRLVKSSSFHAIDEADELKSSTSSLVKSSTFDSLLEIDSTTEPSLESEIKESAASLSNPSPTTANSIDNVPSENDSDSAMQVGLETFHHHHHKLAWGAHYPTNGRRHIHSKNNHLLFDETLESYGGDVPRGKFSQINGCSSSMQQNVRAAGYYDERVPSNYHRNGKTLNSFGGKQTFNEHSDTAAIQEYDNDQQNEKEEEDLNIVDFEVTNSETETTVFLKHIWARSSLNDDEDKTNMNSVLKSNGSRTSGPLWTMPSIEESDSEESESYYESEDAVIVTTPVPNVPYTLPVPTVNLVDEDGTILEVILQGREGLSPEDLETTNTVDSNSSAAVEYTPQTVYDDLGPSTRL